MDLRFATCFVLLLGLGACLENEEEITIRADGSSTVQLTVKGQCADLLDGYALPLGAPWSATSPQLAALVPDFNAVDAPQRLQAGLQALAAEQARAKAAQSVNPEPDVELSVRADFASVAQWPTLFAPAEEPYRNAYLRRSAGLTIERKNGHTVFVFERTYQARDFERYDVWGLMEHELPAELFQKVERGSDSWTDPEREKTTRALRLAIVRSALAFADDALLSHYVQGDAALASTAASATHARIETALETLVTPSLVRTIVALVLKTSEQQEQDAAAMELERLNSAMRDLLRTSLESALQGYGLPPATRNAVRGELESRLAAYDATSDLDDESFQVSVHMPGVVVGGNYDEQDANGVRWKFEGKSLHDRTRVLRVVSVVD